MINKLLTAAVIILLASVSAFSQNGTSSPYSFYGIGELKFDGTVENRSMGGLSVYSDSIHLNLQNPASLGKLKLTNISIGGEQDFITQTTDNQSAKGSSSTIDYVALGLPLGKFSTSVGLTAYTSGGYKTGGSDPANAEVGDSRYSGTGGLNRVFWAGGYSINKNLQIGAEINYQFGKIENEAIYITGVTYDVKEYNQSKLTGLGFNLGLMYSGKINENMSLFSSLSYAPEINMKSDNYRTLSTIVFNPNNEPIEREVSVQDLEALGLAETDFKLPSRLTLGAGIGQEKKWFAGADFTFLGTSSLINRTFNPTNVEFNNSTKVSVGGFYIPRYNSLTSYWNRVVYRAGFRYENTGLEINDRKINEFGMSFGAGLPVGRLFSNVNLGVEYGIRGTTEANLVKERFVNLNISLSFNDRWFQRRRID